jgi:hypothetical protein
MTAQDYRNINVSHLLGATPQPQAVPSLQWVNIADLVIDERYQRPMGPRNWAAVQKIANCFDWAQFSAVQVAPIIGGKFAVIDGQHRVHAAALCGFEQVPALVVLVPEGAQARAFVGMNASAIRLTPTQMYRAALSVREVWAGGVFSFSGVAA